MASRTTAFVCLVTVLLAAAACVRAPASGPVARPRHTQAAARSAVVPAGATPEVVVRTFLNALAEGQTAKAAALWWGGTPMSDTPSSPFKLISLTTTSAPSEFPDKPRVRVDAVLDIGKPQQQFPDGRHTLEFTLERDGTHGLWSILGLIVPDAETW
jgi:hypothetical protein